jgi:potassium-dependent mechanosensitive channel
VGLPLKVRGFGLVVALAALAALAGWVATASLAQERPNAAPENTTVAPSAPVLPTALPTPNVAGAPGSKAGTAQVPTIPEPAAVPPPPPPLALPTFDDVLEPIARANAAIELIAKQIERFQTSESGLSQQRSDLDAVLADMEHIGASLGPRLDAVKLQAEKLGPPPKPDQPEEAAPIAAERARLVSMSTTLDGAFKSTELNKVRARQLIARVQELRQGLFAQNLFQRTASPLLPGVWQQIGVALPSAVLQFNAVFGTWWGIVRGHPVEALLVLGLTILTYLVLLLIARRSLAHLMPASTVRPPSFTKRAAAASVAAPLYALPAAAAVIVAYIGLGSADLIYSRVEAFVEQLLQGSLIYIVIVALARAILEPARPVWRLMNLSNGAARALLSSSGWIALVYVLDLILKDILRLLALPLSFTIALSFATSLAFAALLLRVVLTPFHSAPGNMSALAATGGDPAAVPPPLTVWQPRWLKVPLLAVALVIAASTFAGYVAFGRFVAGQVVITGSAAVLVGLLHLAIKTIARSATNDTTILGALLGQGLSLEMGQRRGVGFGLSAILHAVLALVTVPGVLLALGFSLDDVSSGLKSAVFGFQLGHFKISLAQIMLAIGLFVGLLFVTRLLQRWLQSGVLRAERMDPGIANSIHQGVGYTGIGLATLAAVSYGGIDITNLAILAGALSVGIGFGLQSIVNNFVSGLILLVERPIKVGDWIVVKGGEGHVRSISVRSTEIETFDRASLIVPNSELISNVVVNWTHRNALGRVAIKVNTSYKSDPDQVLAVLAGVAKASTQILQQPAPLITLDQFGNDGLEFTMRVVVADINKALGVQTNLRAAIFKAFVANGIEFPTAERDIYLRDLDGVKSLVARVLEERARNAATADQNADPVDATVAAAMSQFKTSR